MGATLKLFVSALYRLGVLVHATFFEYSLCATYRIVETYFMVTEFGVDGYCVDFSNIRFHECLYRECFAVWGGACLLLCAHCLFG